MNGFDADDYLAGGKNAVIPWRDYVPPGGMRKYPEDSIERKGGGSDNVLMDVEVAHVTLPVIPAIEKGVQDDAPRGSVVCEDDGPRGRGTKYMYRSESKQKMDRDAKRKLRGEIQQDPTSGIRCPVCGGDDLGCVDSRAMAGGGRRRRYKCNKDGCTGRVITIERPE